MGGGAEAAEDHRPEPLRQQPLHLPDQLAQLRVLGQAAQGLRSADHVLQLLAVGFDRQVSARCCLLFAHLLIEPVEHPLAGQGFQLAELLFLAQVAITLLRQPRQLGAQRGRRCRRTAADAPQQRQRRPPTHPLPQPALANAALHQGPGVLEHVVEQRPPIARELVGGLSGLPIREVGPFSAPFRPDVLAAPLHEMATQLLPKRIALRPIRQRAKRLELRMQQSQQVVEAFAVAAMGRGGEQHQMAIAAAGQTAQQLIALVPAPAFAAGAAVGFIDDHEITAAADEAIAVVVTLDRVEAHHREGVGLEQGVSDGQILAEPADRAGPDHLSR